MAILKAVKVSNTAKKVERKSRSVSPLTAEVRAILAGQEKSKVIRIDGLPTSLQDAKGRQTAVASVCRQWAKDKGLAFTFRTGADFVQLEAKG